MSEQDHADLRVEVAYIRGRLDELVDLTRKVSDDHEQRITKVERGQTYVLGATGAVGALASFFGLKLGLIQ